MSSPACRANRRGIGIARGVVLAGAVCLCALPAVAHAGTGSAGVPVTALTFGIDAHATHTMAAPAALEDRFDLGSVLGTETAAADEIDLNDLAINTSQSKPVASDVSLDRELKEDRSVASAASQAKAAAQQRKIAEQILADRRKNDSLYAGMGAATASAVTDDAMTSGSAWRTAQASWYGSGFYGRHMASGGVLKTDSVILAHKSLPFGTRVLIRFNGREIVAPVMDRGPYVAGREFDLGPGTAKALHFTGVHNIWYRILGN